jgi:thiamine-monophosphate kinase
MKGFSEFDFIAELPRRIGHGLQLGIGDDAAVFGSESWAVSSDAMSEGSHFLALDDPEAVGKKLAAINFSDMAAMACEPRFILLNLHLGSDWTEKARLAALMQGFQGECERFDVILIGGDTVSTAQKGLHCSATVIGSPMGKTPVRRSGAQIGDVVAVSGPLGGSYPHRHLKVEPRLDVARKLVKMVDLHAMMDISDGLSQDLGHMLDRSGVGARLELGQIPLHRDSLERDDRLAAALGDGEDFELLFTLSPEDAESVSTELEMYPIGTIVEGEGSLWGREHSGRPWQSLERCGFRHDH